MSVSLRGLVLGLLALTTGAWAQGTGAGDPSALGAPVPPPPEVVEQLHDVRPPVAFEPTWRPIDYAVAGSALLAAAIAFLAWRARRPATADAPAPPPGPPPHAVALDRLDALRAQRLYQSGAHGHLRLATELPAILKEYLDAIQRSRFVTRTTRETHADLSNRVPRRLVEAATWLLIECDRVKFAGQQAFARDPIDTAEGIVRELAAAWAEEERA